MKTTPLLRRCLALLLIVLSFQVAAPPPARADFIDTLADVLDAVPGFVPVSGKDIRDSRKFFDCLSNADSDTKVLACLDQFKDTPLGQDASTAIGGVPSWFWDLIDLYIAVRSDDFWGVVAKLGEAAICAVAQIMTGGAVDVCGLIEELVKVGKALLDAATAVAEFFQSVGEGAWEAAKAVGCSLGLGGCGESSPPEQRAYAWVFAPEVPAGLTARKAVDPFAFNILRQKLEADASAKPAKLHIPVPPNWVKEYYSAGVVSTASNVYTNVVGAQWSSDMAKSVVPLLAKKRSEYDNPQQVANLAGLAAADYAKNEKLDPYQEVAKRCSEDFSKGFGFAHVDRWIQLFPNEAKGLGGLKSNPEWCGTVFRPKNKGNFAEHFRNFAKSNYCPPFGQNLLCPTVAKYESCLGLMGSVDQKDQCRVNVSAAGKEAAAKIAAELKAKGSKIPCQIVSKGLKGGTQPVDFVCTRPTQGKACEEIYQKLFGELPVKLVNCVVEKNSDYAALESKVAQAAVALKGEFGVPFGIDSIDPLIVHASTAQIAGQVKDKNPNFGFGPPSGKPGFDYYLFQFPRTIDGMSTPALGIEVKLPAAKQTVQVNKIQEKVALVKPGDPDPTGKLSIGADKLSPSVAAPPAAVGAAQLQAPAPRQTMSRSLPPGSAPGTGAPKDSLGAAGGNLAAAPGAAPAPKGPDLGGVPAPAPMHGPAPPSGGRQAPAVARLSDSVDIKSGPRVTVAGKYPVAWGQAVTISDADARRVLNGVCEVAVLHDTLNSGSAATGSFGRRWVNLQNPAPVTDSYPPIPAGGSARRTDTLQLKPGVNRLTLTLDYLNQVPEGNDANNSYQLTVTVNGNCGLSTPASPPAPGRGVQTAPVPATRLPAIQQPQAPPNPTQPRLNLPRQ
jgi:hypothetical protein